MKKLNQTRNFILIMLLIAFSFSGFTKTYTSAKSGSWSKTNTWVNNQRPPTSLGSNDVVNINHAVTMSSNVSCYGDIIINQNGALNSTSKYLWMRGLSELKVYGSIYVANIYLYNRCTLISTGVVQTKYDLYVQGNVTATFNDLCEVGDDLLIYAIMKYSSTGAHIIFNDELYVHDDFLMSWKSDVKFKDDVYINDDIIYIDGTASFEGNTYVGGKCNEIYYSDGVVISGTLQVIEDFTINHATVTVSNTGSIICNKNLICKGSYADFTNNGTVTVADDYVFSAGEFTNNGTFTVNSDVDNKDDLVNGSSGVFTCNGEFKNDGSITNAGIINIDEFDNNDPVTNNNTINVFETFDNDGTCTNNSNGKIVLKSTSTGSATLIDGGTIKGSGNCVIELFLSGDNWHYVSIPIESASSNVFWGGAIYSFNEATETWTAHSNDESLDVTKGYDVYFKDDKTIEFIGKFRNSDQTISTKKTGSSKGYNLIVNPYPSAIDWKKSNGWNKSNIADGVYIWDPATQNITSYVNGVGNNKGSRYIAPMQGYFVKCTGSSGNVKAKNNSRKHKGNGKFRSDEVETNDELLKLTVHADNGFADETVIRFNRNSSIKFDGDFDADKMWSTNIAVPQIYTKSSDFTDLSINSIPEVKKEVSIPLYMKARVSGNNSIELDLRNTIDICDVYLEDVKLKTFHNMLTGPYAFSSDVQDEDFRFIIHFAKQSAVTADTTKITLDVVDNEEDKLFKAYSSAGAIVIEQDSRLEKESTVRIYNMVGKVVKKLKTKESYNRIELNAAAAFYTVQINNGKLSYTQKLLVN